MTFLVTLIVFGLLWLATIEYRFGTLKNLAADSKQEAEDLLAEAEAALAKAEAHLKAIEQKPVAKRKS